MVLHKPIAVSMSEKGGGGEGEGGGGFPYTHGTSSPRSATDIILFA